MKKYIVILAAAAFFAACGGSGSKGNGSDSTVSGSDNGSAMAAGDISTNPDYQKGLALIGASDCLTCHKVEEKLVGPAYKDVADKYAGMDTAVTYLAHRIINGVGAYDKHNWAEETNNGIMTPHPQVSEADAEQMVKYVLLLKTK